ncbi:MAG: DUF6465 family protein [Lachnospiraceae bacterium]|nr:DUF6465 family protein [Lachnospiraceae bacterium]
MQKKAEVKASTVKASETKTETKKPVEVKAAEVKETAKAVEVKAAAKVEEVKETVKTAKTVAKKPVAKKAEKKEFEPEVFIQFYGNESAVKDVVERAKDAFVAEGHRASSIKSLKVYLKPEEYAAYYVINEKSVGRINLF